MPYYETIIFPSAVIEQRRASYDAPLFLRVFEAVVYCFGSDFENGFCSWGVSELTEGPSRDFFARRSFQSHRLSRGRSAFASYWAKQRARHIHGTSRNQALSSKVADDGPLEISPEAQRSTDPVRGHQLSRGLLLPADRN